MHMPAPDKATRDEARTLLQQVKLALLDMERDPDDQDRMTAVFDALQAIKRSGAMAGFAPVVSFVHEFETAFDQIRQNNTPVSPAAITAALDAKDHMRKLVEQPNGDHDGGDDILDALRWGVSGDTVPAAPTSARDVNAERVDELMERLGELAIAQARLTQIANRGSDGNLKTVADEFERLGCGLRDAAMGIRNAHRHPDQPLPPSGAQSVA